MKAQAAIMYAVNEPLRIEEVLLDEPARGEVLDSHRLCRRLS